VAQKIYLVKTWDKAGSLVNNYEVTVESDAELAHLRKFLRTKFGHVLLERQADKAPKAVRGRHK
jgi:hypothetical protein